METNREKLSRRQFISSASVVATSLALGSGLFLGGCNSKTETTKARTKVAAKTDTGTATDAIEIPKWPYPYEKLDPETIREKGYKSWYEGGCTYGVIHAIIAALRDKVGGPYNSIPVDMFRFGEGGVAGWSTICGTLLGGGAALTLIGGKDSFKELVSDLMGFYTEANFPSKNHDKHAKFKGQVQSVSGSPLCHVSVTTWCKMSGKKSFSPEREDRCAKVTGDVAARTVELLNTFVDGKFKPSYVLPEIVQNCRSCHDKGGSLENTRGMMNCVPCHDEPHKS